VRANIQSLLAIAFERVALLQPEAPLRVSVRKRDFVSVDRKLDEARAARHLQEFGQRVPQEASAHLVLACGQLDMWVVRHGDHRNGRTTRPHILGPAPAVTGQRDRSFAIQEPTLRELPFLVAQRQAESRRPRADTHAGVPGEGRTGRIAAAVQSPVHPGRERGRHGFSLERFC
jgi:hypothetical protein